MMTGIETVSGDDCGSPVAMNQWILIIFPYFFHGRHGWEILDFFRYIHSYGPKYQLSVLRKPHL